MRLKAGKKTLLSLGFLLVIIVLLAIAVFFEIPPPERPLPKRPLPKRQYIIESSLRSFLMRYDAETGVIKTLDSLGVDFAAWGHVFTLTGSGSFSEGTCFSPLGDHPEALSIIILKDGLPLRIVMKDYFEYSATGPKKSIPELKERARFFLGLLQIPPKNTPPDTVYRIEEAEYKLAGDALWVYRFPIIIEGACNGFIGLSIAADTGKLLYYTNERISAEIYPLLFKNSDNTSPLSDENAREEHQCREK